MDKNSKEWMIGTMEYWKDGREKVKGLGIKEKG